MKTIAIILGHPAKRDTFCAALAHAYLDGASEAGHSTSIIDIAEMDIPFLEGYDSHKDHDLPDDILQARKKLKEAEHWIIIYPLWMGMMPAKLKAFFEWVMGPGFAMEAEGQGFPKGLLKGKSVRIILTMGMPGFFYKWYYGAHSLKAFQRNLLNLCGISKIKKTLYGFIEAAGDEKRKKWLKDVKELGREGR